MQALHDVVKAGYVRYIGMSSCFAYQCESSIRCMLRLVELKPRPAVHAMQSAYIPLDIYTTDS